MVVRFDGEDEVIDRLDENVVLGRYLLFKPLTFAEAIERLPMVSNGLVDEDFERDVNGFCKRHAEPLDSSKWD